jgi:hypothetical protein
MIKFLKWQWETSDAWQKRNIIWFTLLILSILISPYLLPILVFGIVLVADSIICALIDSYKCYLNSHDKS